MQTHTHTQKAPFIFSVCVCVCVASCACFENINLFHHDWYIWEQSEHNQISCLLMHDFIHKKHWVNAENCTQLNWPHRNTPNRHPTTSSICLRVQRVLWATPTHTWVTNFWFQTNLFLPIHKNSKAAAFLAPLPQDKFRTLPKSNSIVIIAFRYFFFFFLRYFLTI